MPDWKSFDSNRAPFWSSYVTIKKRSQYEFYHSIWNHILNRFVYRIIYLRLSQLNPWYFLYQMQLKNQKQWELYVLFRTLTLNHSQEPNTCHFLPLWLAAPFPSPSLSFFCPGSSSSAGTSPRLATSSWLVPDTSLSTSILGASHTCLENGPRRRSGGRALPHLTILFLWPRRQFFSVPSFLFLAQFPWKDMCHVEATPTFQWTRVRHGRCRSSQACYVATRPKWGNFDHDEGRLKSVASLRLAAFPSSSTDG